MLLALLGLFAQDPCFAKTTHLSWGKVDGAYRYELRLSRSSSMSPVTLSKKVPSPELKVDLAPGTYYFRVRGITVGGQYGPWTGLQSFAVRADPPRQVAPENEKVFYSTSVQDGVWFRWGKSGPKTEYRLQIRDSKRIVYDKKTRKRKMKWTPPDPGRYAWRVAYQNKNGSEWTDYRNVEIDRSVFGLHSSKKKVRRKKKRKSPSYSEDVAMLASLEKDYASRSPSSISRHGGKKSLGIALRAGQVVTNHSLVTENVSQSGDALALTAQAELTLPFSRPRSNDWGLEVGALAGIYRQEAYEITETLPRFALRLKFLTKSARWTFGPMIQGSLTRNMLFFKEGNNDPFVSRFWRQGLGAGLAARYMTGGKSVIRLAGVARIDMGGESPSLGEFGSTFGWEGLIGYATPLSRSLNLESEIKFSQEAQSWGDDNEFSNLFISLALGLGLKF